MIARCNIDAVRGDTIGVDVVVDGDIEGVVQDIRMTARKPATDAVLFSVSKTGGGVEVTDEGWYIRVPPTSTQDATPGVYDYDIEFTIVEEVHGKAETNIYTPVFGTLTLWADQSRVS